MWQIALRCLKLRKKIEKGKKRDNYGPAPKSREIKLQLFVKLAVFCLLHICL
jgi:hypothetical protein